MRKSHEISHGSQAAVIALSLGQAIAAPFQAILRSVGHLFAANHQIQDYVLWSGQSDETLAKHGVTRQSLGRRLVKRAFVG